MDILTPFKFKRVSRVLKFIVPRVPSGASNQVPVTLQNVSPAADDTPFLILLEIVLP
ncbi:hypothetical protein L0128_19240 [candidate division KSB1 bacterium]|nr:hypothetical protein [candidate division KSB1 bacterium]